MMIGIIIMVVLMDVLAVLVCMGAAKSDDEKQG